MFEFLFWGDVVFENILDKLSSSKFRSNFYLKENDIKYVKENSLKNCYFLILGLKLGPYLSLKKKELKNA